MNMFASSNHFDMNSILKNSPLSKRTRAHLNKVYLALMMASLFATAGCYLQISTGFHHPLLTFIVSICTLLWVNSSDRSNVQARLGGVLLFGFLQGLSVGPLIDIAFRVDPHIVVTSLLTTSVVFTSFSLTAIYSERRSWLYLGGIFSSFFSILFVLSIMNFFFNTPLAYLLNLYGGLLIFSLYVIYDTQMIIEKNCRGDDDFVGHSISLFIDLIGILVRILVILLRNSERKEGKKSRK